MCTGSMIDMNEIESLRTYVSGRTLGSRGAATAVTDAAAPRAAVGAPEAADAQIASPVVATTNMNEIESDGGGSSPGGSRGCSDDDGDDEDFAASGSEFGSESGDESEQSASSDSDAARLASEGDGRPHHQSAQSSAAQKSAALSSESETDVSSSSGSESEASCSSGELKALLDDAVVDTADVGMSTGAHSIAVRTRSFRHRIITDDGGVHAAGMKHTPVASDMQGPGGGDLFSEELSPGSKRKRVTHIDVHV
jgi:hypothetical protein